MAKVLPNGLVSGACGELVYYALNGKQCSRIRNRNRNTNSLKQKFYQKKMATVGKFMSQMLDVVKIGWHDKHSHHFQKAVGYHMKNAVETCPANGMEDSQEFIVNIEKVLLSKGKIPPPEITTITRQNYVIEFSWQTELLTEEYRKSDSMVLVVWKQGLKAKAYTGLGNRIKGKGKIVLPFEFEGTVNIWAFYRNHIFENLLSEMNVSNSVYLGEV